jgi:3-keto-5-aminohexanoate cleavage enzyme
MTAAAALGGHLRVGFENNLLLKNGGLAPDNRALVEQAAAVGDGLGLRLATAQSLRERFR